MIKTSEFVSIGHSDRMADYIASRIITEIYAKDGKKAHAAIEVAIFDNKVIIGGEATTTLEMTSNNLTPIVKKALQKIGYDNKYREKFSREECYIDDDYEILVFVNKQSPDIAKGTTDKVDTEPGWNDQGTYVGYASNNSDNYLSLEHYLATSLGNFIYQTAKYYSTSLGIDIKTLIQVEYDNETPKVKGITVACPTIREVEDTGIIKNLIEMWKSSLSEKYSKMFGSEKIIVNGTGTYHRHGSLGDSGLSGRKLVVNQCGNFAAGGSMIKPILASDRLLNLYARHLSLLVCKSLELPECQIELSASIGQTYLESIRISCKWLTEEQKDKIEKYLISIPVSPNILNNQWKTLEKNNYHEAVYNNFFGSDNYDIEPWEEIKEIEIINLCSTLKSV